MVDLRPFAALRPRPDRAAAIASLPYDVVTREESRREIELRPDSFLRVVRPDALAGELSYEELGAASKRELATYLERGDYLREPTPCFYAYRLSQGQHSQIGLVATGRVDDYENNIIKRHEHTRPDKVRDRTEHFRIMKAQTGPVYFAFRGTDETRAVLARVAATPALYDFVASDGVRHEVFRIPETGPVERAFAQIPAAYIADGHHRSESMRELRRLRNCQGTSDPANRFFGVFFPAEQLQILSYNRLIKSLGAETPESFLKALQTRLPVREDKAARPSKGKVVLFLGSRCFEVDVRGAYGLTAPERVDAHAFQVAVFGPLLGIVDPRTDARLSFLGGLGSFEAIAAAVANGQAAAGVALAPVAVEEVLAVADAGEVMPPKSTWFEPKLRSGLFIYEL